MLTGDGMNDFTTDVKNNKMVWQVERRAHERYSADLDARLFYGNLIYSAKVTDVSRKGMFIKTNIGFPVNSEFMMVFLIDGLTMKMPVKVRRKTAAKRCSDADAMSGIGVELLDCSTRYMDFVDTVCVQ